MKTKTNKYFAFISYQRQDEEWAKWLQHKLENYKLPSNLKGESDFPKEIRPIFRDKTEFASGILSDEIRKALDSSKHLIVICSPRAAQSEWVGKEVQYFIDQNRTKEIIPFVIEGTVHSREPENECFPSALLGLPREQELIGINIEEMGRDAAVVKVVAQMFGLGFDDLWQRYEREQKRKRNWIIAASIIAFLIMAGVAFWMYLQRGQTLKANWKMMENQSRFVSEIIVDIAEKDSYLARLLAIDILPKDIMRPERPYTPEAEASFRKASYLNSAIFRGHTSSVLSANFSPNGELIVSASADSTLRIWDVKTGTILNSIKGHSDTVISVSFSPDGKKIISLSNDGTVKIWDVDTGKELKTTVVKDPSSILTDDGFLSIVLELKHSYGYYFIPKEGPSSVCFSNDNKTVGSLCFSNTIRIWDMNTNDSCILKGHTSFVHSIDFSPDGNYLISASSDSTIKIWDVRSKTNIKTIIGHNSPVQFAKYSPSGKQIVSVGDDHIIKLWNVDDGSLLKEFFGHTNQVISVAFSPDGKRIISASFDNSIIIWDIQSGEDVQHLIGHEYPVNSAYFSPDGKSIVSASYDNTIRIWDIEKKQLHQKKGVDTCAILSLSFSPDGKRFAAARRDGGVDIWDFSQKKIIKTLKGHNRSVNSVSFLFDGKSVLSASSDGKAIIWDVESGDWFESVTSNCAIRDADISSNGVNVVLAFSDDENSIVIWNRDSENTTNILKGHTDKVQSVAFNPDGTRIVSASNDGTVIIWDVETLKPICTLRGHDSFVYHAAFSHDGNKIVSASQDLSVRIWDVKTGDMLCVLKGHSNGIFWAEFSPDDKYVVSASCDQMVKVWDAESGMLIENFEGNMDWIWSAVFNPNGKNVVSAAEDGAILFWDFPSLQDLIDQTRERFKNRTLTPEERKKYYLE